VLATLLAALLAAAPVRGFADERLLLDRRLEALRRVLPDGPAAAADVQHVRDLAAQARLARVEIQPRAPVESGTRGEVVLDVSALGGYEEVDRFFQKVALSHRLVDVETLTLTATTEDVVQLATVLRLPYWPARAPLPPPPESPRGRPAGVPKPTLDAFLRDQSLALAKSEVVAARRRTRRNPRLFLSELSAAARERPVVLSYAALGEEFTIRGMGLGDGPMRAFESRLERGFFRLSDFLMARQGACYRFEAHGHSPVAGPDAPLPLPVEDPFEQDATPCRADRDGGRGIAVRGRAPSAKDPGHGPITLRLRDVDLTDVFDALSVVGAGAYVVDEAVAGRTSVEVTRATLDEVLQLLRKSAGIEVTDGGAVRRVSPGGRPAVRHETPAGGTSPASFSLKRAEVRDVLAAMAEADASLASLGPPGYLGRVSVWARNAPVGAVRAAVLDAASLTERTEEGQRILEAKTGASDPPAPVARSDHEPRLALGPDDLTVRELELAGLASVGDAFVAFAYSPTGELFSYRAGDRLFDAVVKSVDANEVLLDTEEGSLRLALPPMVN
jgi:hypothetical protein